MDHTVEELRRCLADCFILYFKIHSCHWNVTGRNFYQDHKFFQELYEEIFSSIDDYAEHIRILGQFAPVSLHELYKHISSPEDSSVGNAEEMIDSIIRSNQVLLNDLNSLCSLANETNQQGLVDFISGRIRVHTKYDWQLKSSRRK